MCCVIRDIILQIQISNHSWPANQETKIKTEEIKKITTTIYKHKQIKKQLITAALGYRHFQERILKLSCRSKVSHSLTFPTSESKTNLCVTGKATINAKNRISGGGGGEDNL